MTTMSVRSLVETTMRAFVKAMGWLEAFDKDAAAELFFRFLADTSTSPSLMTSARPSAMASSGLSDVVNAVVRVSSRGHTTTSAIA